MKYFVFTKSGRKLDHLASFRTLKAARAYVVQDILMMKRQCPDMKWCESDYVVARRVG